jgi:hypothetical protein
MKRALLAFAAVLAVALPSRAFACSCAYPLSEREALARADVAFEGTVTRVRTVRDSVSYRRRVYTFAVRGWRKGGEGRGRTVEIRTGMGGGDCGYVFARRRVHAVFAYADDDGRLSTSICSMPGLAPDPPPVSVLAARRWLAALAVPALPIGIRGIAMIGGRPTASRGASVACARA